MKPGTQICLNIQCDQIIFDILEHIRI